MLIKNVSILYGNELDYINSTNIRISGQFIKEIGMNLKPEKKEDVMIAKDYS